MICLYYNSATKNYGLLSEIDLSRANRPNVSIIERFERKSQRLAQRICENLNLARLVS